ncbi:MAG: CPBP family intramembrane glutamic endopeptidase [Acidimicrobiales bacterium]
MDEARAEPHDGIAATAAPIRAGRPLVYRVNPALQGASASVPAAQLLGVLGAVVSTTLAGLVFCFLRLRSRNLLAPILLHLATNDLGYLAA